MADEKKKTGYQSPWEDQLKETANKIINREKFSYDVNGDALYKQYKDRYTQQGKQAMMDTMGQAAALTGGYGNSYAQSVGQQTYQGYMQGLTDKIPTLYQIALDKYTTEGNQMRDNMNLMMQQDEIGYGRYRDQMADQEDAYNKLVALMTNYHYEPTAEEMAAAGMPETHKNAIMKPYYDMLAERAAASNMTGGSGGSTPYDSERVRQVQQMLNQLGWSVPVDGVFGDETRKAYAEYNERRINGGTTEFTGSTYSEAVAYMKNNGVNSDQAAGILTADEWRRAKKSGSPRYGANEFSSYNEYLQYAVDANIAAKEKE